MKEKRDLRIEENEPERWKRKRREENKELESLK